MKQISGIKTSINNLKNVDADLNNQIRSLNSQISLVSTRLDNIKNQWLTWKRGDDKNNSNIAYSVLEGLGICSFWLYGKITKDSTAWENIPGLPAVKTQYKPGQRKYFVVSWRRGDGILVSLNNQTGKFQYKSNIGASKSSPQDFYVTGMYHF